MGDSAGTWGDFARASDPGDDFALELMRVFDQLEPLRDQDVPGLDELLSARNLTRADMARTGVRLTGDGRELAWIWPGGLKFRNILKGTHRSETGSAFTHLGMMRPAAPPPDGEPRVLLLAEGQTDMARLGALYPHAHVGTVPQGVAMTAGGKAVLPPRALEQIAEFDVVYACHDADEAGDAIAAYFQALVPTITRHRPPAPDWCGLPADAPAPPLPEPGKVDELGYTFAELLRKPNVEPDWLIPGLLAKGWLVKVAAREKTGKGTFMFYLLGALEAQEPTPLGPAYHDPVTALIFTEEPEDSVQEKAMLQGGKLKDGRVLFHHSLPSAVRDLGVDARWKATADLLVALAVQGGHGVLFVDNFSRAAQVDDENGTEMSRRADVLIEAARSADAGLCVVIDHHHRKATGDVTSLSRGGTGLAGATDVNLEMQRVGAVSSRKRRLTCLGRMTHTCWERTWELDEDGMSYREIAGADDPEDGQDRAWLALLEEHGEAVTYREFVELVGDDINYNGARAWVNSQVEEGRMAFASKKGKSSAFRLVAKIDPDAPEDF